MKDALGGYYTLGRVFVTLIGNPRIVQLATQHGLPRPLGGDALDRVVNGPQKLAPAA